MGQPALGHPLRSRDGRRRSNSSPGLPRRATCQTGRWRSSWACGRRLVHAPPASVRRRLRRSQRPRYHRLPGLKCRGSGRRARRRFPPRCSGRRRPFVWPEPSGRPPAHPGWRRNEAPTRSSSVHLEGRERGRRDATPGAAVPSPAERRLRQVRSAPASQRRLRTDRRGLGRCQDRSRWRIARTRPGRSGGREARPAAHEQDRNRIDAALPTPDRGRRRERSEEPQRFHSCSSRRAHSGRRRRS